MGRTRGERGDQGELTDGVFVNEGGTAAAVRSVRRTVMAAALGFAVERRFGDCELGTRRPARCDSAFMGREQLGMQGKGGGGESSLDSS